MQSPDSEGKYQQMTLGQSTNNTNSIFQSPAPRWAGSSNGFNGMNTITSEDGGVDLNNRDHQQEGAYQEQQQPSIQINRKFDSKSFIDTLTFQYQRKKDDVVQQLLDEYKNKYSYENKNEHSEKWL